MQTDSLYRTTVFRLTAVYVIGFAAALALLGAATYMIVDHRLERRLDDRIRMESVSLQESFRSGGVGTLITTVNAHQQSHPNGALDYAVVQGARRVAGRLTKWPSAPGRSSQAYREEAGETARGTRIQLALTKDKDYVVVSVTDNEPGISAADRDHVFRRFYRGAGPRGFPEVGSV